MSFTRFRQEFIHPELQEGEVFFSNCDSVSFALIPWWSKRKGNRAYNGTGQSLRIKDWFPVFVSKDELRRARVTVAEARQELRARMETPSHLGAYHESLC